MKYMFASDVHGSAYYCRKMLEAYDKEKAERLVLLGDLLYHGPRNDLPKEYAPKDNLPPMMDGDILIHGHTHVLKAENMGNYILLNPGSVSIPKEGNPPTYAILENGIFTIKDFEGNTVREITL